MLEYSVTELYAMDKLNCGIADLGMLENVYSRLGEDCYDPSEFVSEANSLDDLLAYCYDCISDRVKEELYEIADNEDFREGVTDDFAEVLSLYVKEEGGKDMKFIDYLIPENQIEKIKELADKLVENGCYANYLDTHFQNDLDQVVDWDSNAMDNAKNLLAYWVMNGDIELKELEGDV